MMVSGEDMCSLTLTHPRPTLPKKGETCSTARINLVSMKGLCSQRLHALLRWVAMAFFKEKTPVCLLRGRHRCLAGGVARKE